MKLPVYVKKLMIVPGLAVAIMLAVPLMGHSQDQKEKPKGEEQTMTLKIVKDDNGKITVIDTTITTGGKVKTYQYEYRMKDMDKDMAEMEDQLRDMEEDMKKFDIEVHVGDGLEDMDSVFWIGDSIQKRVVIRGISPHGDMGRHGNAFFFGDEDQMRPFRWNEIDDDVFMQRMPMSPQWEAIMQSVPMGHIKGFQIKDRKDGKRIIIDVDDDVPVMMYRMQPRHRDSGHGSRRIIIRSDDMDVPPPPPPPPPAEKPAPKPPDKG